MLFSQKFTKRYFLLTIFFLVLLVGGGSVFAAENPLNTITLEGNPYSSFFVETYRLYVISKEQNRMYVINTNTNKFYSTVRVDNGPTVALPFNNRIYIANSEDNAVSTFYTSGGYKTKVIVGSGPVGLVGVGTTLYVTSFDDTISAIETGADSRFKNIKLVAGVTSQYFTVTGNRIFLHHPINNSVSVWSTSSNSVIKNFAVGQSPQMSVLVGKKLYVINSKSNDVSVVNIDTYSPLKTISVGSGPMYAILSGTKLYVLNTESSSISIVDTLTDTVLKTVTVGKNPTSMVTSGDFIYVTNAEDDSVSFFDTKTETVTKTIPVGDAPKNGTLVGTKLYVNNTKSSSVSILNTTTPTLSSITTATPNGTYAEGTKIKIEAKFDQYISPASSLTIVLDNNRELMLKTTQDSIVLSGEYVVQSGDDTKDLTVKSIKSADIISLFGHNSKTYVPPANNLGRLKNIIIKTSNTPVSPTSPTACEESGMYRLCPLTKTPENSAKYRENMLCEGFVSEDQSRSKRISRIEVLNIAVNMLRGTKSAAADYSNTYTDITPAENSQETVAVIQTGLDNALIFANGGAFEPTKKISRIEAYALLMRGVCMSPVEDEADLARAIHQKAMQESITSKQWAKFRPYSVITRNEVFIVASALADWADKNGGCDKLECRK